MLGDISYDKTTLKSEGKQSIHSVTHSIHSEDGKKFLQTQLVMSLSYFRLQKFAKRSVFPRIKLDCNVFLKYVMIFWAGWDKFNKSWSSSILGTGGTEFSIQWRRSFRWEIFQDDRDISVFD